jgi:hypothetical protein
MHRDNQQDDDDPDNEYDTYDPKIYVKLTNWEPDPCGLLDVEKELTAFRKQFLTLVRNNQPKPTSNLSKRQEKLLAMLRKAKQFIISPTDKNLGPAIMERSQYIQRCFQDHLTNKSTYQRLSTDEATILRYNSRGAIIKTVSKKKPKVLNHAETTYFNRSFSAVPIRRPPQFYILPKVHKTPWKTRPVVSCVGSFNEIASKWLDYKLSKVVDLCPSYTKDSYQILQELHELGELPPTAQIFTADAVSMYTNIDTEHGLETIEKWLDLHRTEILAKHTDFPFKMINDLLRIVMTNNVFQFDDCWYHQLNGTAMGTSVACIYATIYYSFHEETKLLTTYQSSLLYYRRFIDDVLGIWTPTDPDDSKWPAFKADLSFGLLRWETEDLAYSVNFLDLTISIDRDYKLTTRTFQKAMNLYLYLCPSSSHPPSVMKGLVYGSVRRFWLQNSNPNDYRNVIYAFFTHLRARGHTTEKLLPLFLEAANHVDSNQKEKPPRAQPSIETPESRPLFFHIQYHPLELPSSLIRTTFDRCCPILREELSVDRIIVAHSRQPNLRDLLCKTQFQEPEGQRASNILSTLLDPPPHT